MPPPVKYPVNVNLILEDRGARDLVFQGYLSRRRRLLETRWKGVRCPAGLLAAERRAWVHLFL